MGTKNRGMEGTRRGLEEKVPLGVADKRKQHGVPHCPNTIAHLGACAALWRVAHFDLVRGGALGSTIERHARYATFYIRLR